MWRVGVVVRRYINILIIIINFAYSIYNRTGVNFFWIVDNSQQVLNRLRKTNYFSPAKHFDSFDFYTLYTSIPHDSLKMALTSLVMETYR